METRALEMIMCVRTHVFVGFEYVHELMQSKVFFMDEYVCARDEYVCAKTCVRYRWICAHTHEFIRYEYRDKYVFVRDKDVFVRDKYVCTNSHTHRKCGGLSSSSVTTQICVTHTYAHICDRTHTYVRHGMHTHVIGHTHINDMTYKHMWQDTHICATWHTHTRYRTRTWNSKSISLFSTHSFFAQTVCAFCLFVVGKIKI